MTVQEPTEESQSALQDARDNVFECFGEILGAIERAMDLDPNVSIDKEHVSSYVWRRNDGVSITFTATGMNEVNITLQVPADDILAWKDQHGVD